MKIEKKGLISIFPSAKGEILDFLLIYQHWDYNKADISKNTDISYQRTFDVVNELVKEKIVKKTRKVGKSEMYQIDMNSPMVRELKRLQLALMFGDMKSAPKEERKMIVATT